MFFTELALKHPRLKAFLIHLSVFILFFAIFYYIQFSFPYLADTDPWYHIKHALLIRTQGAERSVAAFPWLEHSIIRDYPADLWFGYHLLLIPFTFGDPIIGGKTSAVLFASLVFLGFFWVLGRLGARYAFFWTLFLFFVTHYYFSFRLILARPHTVSIFFFLLGVYFISQRKYLGLFLLSLAWSFISPEAVLIVGMGGVWFLIQWWQEKGADFKTLALPVLGVFIGALFRPGFLNNLYLLYHQVFTSLILRFKGVGLNFGQEIAAPFITIESPALNLFLFSLTALLTVYIFFNLFEKGFGGMSSLHLFLSSLLFLFAIVSVFFGTRFVEYWTPLTVLLGGLVFSSFIVPGLSEIFLYFKTFKNYNLAPTPAYSLERYQRVYRAIRETFLFLGRRAVKLCLQAILFLCLLYFVVLQVILLSRPWTKPDYIKDMRAAAEWLKENTPVDSLVMNKYWHNFPLLFFYNDQNHYALGMDPTFMYVKDPRLYWLWRHLPEEGKICDQERCPEGISGVLEDEKVRQIFKEEFGADYILLEVSPGDLPKEIEEEAEEKDERRVFGKFREALQKSDYFDLVFKRPNVEIYQVF